MSNLDRRRGYTPRQAREERAYRLVVGGTVAGGIGVITLVLAVLGVVSAVLPILALIIAAVCIYGFLKATGQR